MMYMLTYKLLLARSLKISFENVCSHIVVQNHQNGFY